jgi:RNA polymerase sigma-70 factor, ECF subfamily
VELNERVQTTRPVFVASEAPATDLRALFEQHYGSIWRLLRRLGVLSAHLDDAAQEVFWVAARRLADIEPGRAHAFLYGIALRIAANEVRRQGAAMPLADVEKVPLMIDQRPSPEEQMADRQARALLDQALARMPLDLRIVFVLHELEGLEVRQIAEIEAIPVGTASSRLRRAREEFSAIAKRMRATLRPRGGER